MGILLRLQIRSSSIQEAELRNACSRTPTASQHTAAAHGMGPPLLDWASSPQPDLLIIAHRAISAWHGKVTGMSITLQIPLATEAHSSLAILCNCVPFEEIS